MPMIGRAGKRQDDQKEGEDRADQDAGDQLVFLGVDAGAVCVGHLLTPPPQGRLCAHA